MIGGFEELINALPIGEDNAIHQAELAARLGVSRSRAKDEVQAARRAGVPIMSSIKGYWLEGTPGERDRFLRTMSKQAFGRLETIKSLKQEGGENG